MTESLNSHDLKSLEYAASASAGHPLSNPKLNIRDLSPKMQELIGALVIRLLRRRDHMAMDVSDNITYLYTLEQFGVRCPHRFRAKCFHRNADGHVFDGINECTICGTWECPRP